MKKSKSVIFLVCAFFVYSMALLFSKYASGMASTMKFILFYGCSLACIGVYAILWQLALKDIPLNVAYPLKAVTLVISMFFGYIIFHDAVTVPMIVGTVIIFAGVILVGGSHE